MALSAPVRPRKNGRPCSRRNVCMATVPYDQRDGFIWLNGKLIPWGDARLHVLTHGLHYASAVFEGMRAYDGEIFKLTEHSQRLHKSAKILDFEIPYSVAELDKAAREVIARQQADRRLCPPDRLARQRADGRRRAADQDQCRHRRLGLGLVFRSGRARERPAPEIRRLSPARPAHRAGREQGDRALHDLHHREAQGRARRL